MVFPWFPFFVYPETMNRRHRRKNRQKFQEEFTEVQAVTADPIFSTQQQGSSNGMAQFQILCQTKPMATSMRMRLNRLKDERDRKLSLTRQKMDNDESISTLMKGEDQRNIMAKVYYGAAANEEDGQIVDGQQREGELKVDDELSKGTSFEIVEEGKLKMIKLLLDRTESDGEQMEIKSEERTMPLELESTQAATNGQSAECTLLPKAPTENLRVEFSSKDSEVVEMDEGNGKDQKALEEDKIGPSSMEKLLVQPHSTASTSSSSAGTTQLSPRSGSTGKISNKMRGASGSRSGTSSAKQSPRPVHRSTDSIASSLRQTEKKATMESMTTPIVQKRRKSAFETSQAMRDLFGRTEDSPFAGFTSKSRKISHEEKKENEIKNGGKREDEGKMRLEKSEIDEKKLLIPGISQLESCAQMDATPLSTISSTTTLQCHKSITTMTAAPSEWPSRRKLIEDEKADVHLKKGEEEIGKKIEEMKMQIDENQEREKLQNQTNPNKQTQRSNSRTRSVARVAPFAYFPPQEEQRITGQFSPQQASAVKIPLSVQIANNHQIFYSGEVSAITGIVQPEIEREIFSKSIKVNGAKKDQNSSEEEEKQFEKEGGKCFKSGQPIQHQKRWTNNNLERRHNGNGHLKICAIAEQINNNNNKGASDKTLNLTPNRLEQQISSLPGDDKPSKGSAISFGGKDPNGGEQKRGGSWNGHQKEEASNGIGVGGGQGGGGGSGGPLSTLEPLKMVNDNANGTGGNGNGISPQLLIRNATVLNDDECFLADVLIEEGIISEISLESIKSVGPQCEQIDAEGKCLLPAGIDVHTKLLEESFDSIEQRTKAALKGGTGTIIDVLNVRPEETGDFLFASFERALSQISNSAECNIGLSVPIGKWQGNQTRQDILRLTECGVNNFLVDLPSDSELCELLEYTKSIGAFCRISAKDKQILGLLGQRLQNQHISSPSMQITNKFEAHRVQQLCNLAELTNSPLVVQMHSIGSHSHDIAMAIKFSTAIVGAELSAESELFESLASHPNLVSISDNLTEQRMAIIWEKMVLTGKIDPMKFVSVTSTNAAKIFNLYPKKGRIAIGSDADVVLCDLQGTNVQKSFKLVILDGRIRFRQNQFNSIANESPKFERSKGMFLPMALNSPYLFGLIRLREKTFNFANFRRNQQQSVVTNRAKSLQSTRTGTPEEVPSGTHRPISQNHSTQSDQQASRATTKIIHPPGGKSSAFW